MNRDHIYSTLISILALVILIHLFTGDDRAPPEPLQSEQAPPLDFKPGDDQAQAITTLATQLRAEQEARRRLEHQVSDLYTLLRQQNGAAKAGNSAPDPAADARPQASTESSTTSPTTTANRGETGNTWIDEQALLDAGITVDQAASVKKQFEKMEMDRLYLRDRATREGWVGTSRYVDEVDKLDEQTEKIRAELGEDNYGAFLYATGQPNQVLAESVLESSPAQQAGVRAGDVIVSYDGKPIHTWSDVRSATSAGQAGQQVALVLNRDGQAITTYIARGPMGVRLAVRSQKP